MRIFLVALLSVGFSVAAQFSLKAGMSSTQVRGALADALGVQTAWAVLSQPFVLGGFVLYGLGAMVWLAVLANWDVSKAYPLVGLGFVFTALIGWMLGEQMNVYRIAGIVLICAGVALVGRS